MKFAELSHAICVFLMLHHSKLETLSNIITISESQQILLVKTLNVKEITDKMEFPSTAVGACTTANSFCSTEGTISNICLVLAILR